MSEQITKAERESLTSRVDAIHKYWARKPGNLIAHHIERYSPLGGTVLDPFMGSGSTGVQALSLGRAFAGNDLNPFSFFLVGLMLETDLTSEEMENVYADFEVRVKSKVMDLYATKEGDYGLWTVPDLPDQNGMVTDYQLGPKRPARIEYSRELREEDLNTHTKLATPFPKTYYKDRISARGITTVDGLFSLRNRHAISILLDAIEGYSGQERDLLLLALTNSVLHLSQLKSQNIRPLSVNNFWLPKNPVEENAWWRFSERFHKVKVGISAMNQLKNTAADTQTKATLFQGSATDLQSLADNSIDYVFTDPPYGDAIQYSELSHIWNSLLGVPYPTDKEIIVNPTQGKGGPEYLGLLSHSIAEIKRVLKRGGHLTLAFHSKDINLWVGLATALRENAFELVDFLVVKPKGNPFTRNWAMFSPKNDFYITLRSSSEAPRQTSDIDFSEYFNQHKEGTQSESVDTLNDAYDNFVSKCLRDVLQGMNLQKTPSKSAFVREFQQLYG